MRAPGENGIVSRSSQAGQEQEYSISRDTFARAAPMAL